MQVVPLGKLTDELIDQCVDEVYEKFPDLTGVPVDMDKFFDHEVSTIDDVDGIVKGTPFASPWKKIPRLAKMRCIGYFNVCKFLRRNSNDPKKVVGALGDVFSEHIGLDLDERATNDLIRLFDDSDSAKSRASPVVEKFLGIFSGLFLTQDSAEYTFRDETLEISGFVEDAATVSATNGEYVVITQGLYVDVFRISDGYPRVHSEAIENGRVNRTSSNTLDPAVAISGNGKYIAVGVPDSKNGGTIHVYKKKDSGSSWVYTEFVHHSMADLGCRGSFDINDAGLLVYTHIDATRGAFLTVYDTESEKVLIRRSGSVFQNIDEIYVYEDGEYDEKQINTIENEMKKIQFQHRLGRNIKFVDSAAQDWKIRIASGVDVEKMPPIWYTEKDNLVLELIDSHTQTWEKTEDGNGWGLIDTDKDEWFEDGEESHLYITANDWYEFSSPNPTYDRDLFKGRFVTNTYEYSSIPIPMYYEIDGNNVVSHTSTFHTIKNHIRDLSTYNDEFIIHKSGDRSVVRNDVELRIGSTELKRYGEWFVTESGDERKLVDPMEPFICSDGRAVRYCRIQDREGVFNKAAVCDDIGAYFESLYNDTSLSTISIYSTRDGKIGYFDGKRFMSSGTSIKIPPGMENGTKTCIDTGDEFLFGRQIMYYREKRWKLKLGLLFVLSGIVSIVPGVGVALACYWIFSSLNVLSAWNPVSQVLLSLFVVAVAYVGSLFSMLSGGVIGRELLDMWIDDEKFFGKDRRTMLALDRDALVTRGSSKVVENMLKKFFAPGFEKFGDGVDEFFENVKDDVEDKTGNLKEKFDEIVSDIDDKIKDGVSDVKEKFDDIDDKIKDGVSDFKEKFNEKVDDIKDGVSDFKEKFDDIDDKIKDGVSDLKEKFDKRPRRRRGGLFDKKR
jgi:gas vesicle protein